jgi:beta-galactosidase
LQSRKLAVPPPRHIPEADGILYTSADRPVRVEVSGAGMLLGFGSADPSAEERFDATTRRTVDGRALAVLRRTGTIRLLASAPGATRSRP